MFVDFFYLLRRQGINVSTNEWFALLKALSLNLEDTSLERFYHICRAVCIKSEKDFDTYDQCFYHYFSDQPLKDVANLNDKFSEWLKEAAFSRLLTEEMKQQLKALNFDELKKMFEQRLKEQQERHDGGNRWVGTGGTSPFGHSGYHPTGIRVGGEGRNRSAVQVAGERRFANLRSDRILDTRQFAVALRKLRRLSKVGSVEELDLEASIEATAKNAGEIEMVFTAEKKNTVKLLLLMDVGGSMTAYSKLCERLFSAANSINHFKEFRTLFFHNCPYDFLFVDPTLTETVGSKEVMKNLNSDWFLIVVGDAAMSPFELTEIGGCNDYFFHNDTPGITWLKRFKETFPKSVWLNPENPSYWNIHSNRLVRSVFSQMHPLTLEGIDAGITDLLKMQSKGN